MTLSVWLAVVGALVAMMLWQRRRVFLAALIWVRLASTALVFVRLGARLWVRWLAGQPRQAPVLLRQAFEELGPTYIKLAQLLSSSHGLVPERYRSELEGALDHVRPMALGDVELAVAEALASVPGEAGVRGVRHWFREFDPVPLAAASIAQVHAAVLRDGRMVAVKVQRPNVRREMLADLRVMRLLAQLASWSARLRLINPHGIVDDLARTLDEETDFLREAEHLEEWSRAVAALGIDDVRAPRVVRELTTERVLTMERLTGVRIDDVRAIAARGIDGEARLIAGMRAWFKVLLRQGFFHGDVHAGNLLVLDDGGVGLLDFGIVGRLSVEVRRGLAELLAATLSGDFAGVAGALVTLDAVRAPGDDEDRAALTADIDALVRPLSRKGLAQISLAEVLPAVLAVAARHHMHLPHALVLVCKQLLYFDRYAKLLAPGLNIFVDARLVGALMPDLLAARTAS